ncbi:MAG: A/G-specific adenine glycosylase [Christensenellaceae bacterium]|nr:A/G-specific adenine glycosylase [Christensenellaceae bacterium]
MTPEENLKQSNNIPKGFAEALLGWYAHAARKLPWRENIDPYRTWISEIMLQQTRVEAGIGYYLRFIEALPDAASLAAAEEETVLKLWEGLGYYSRARNLHKAAKIIVGEHGGRMPADFAAVRALPGIGDYTAGAICSIAFGMAVPAVDGNVLRVLSRLLASREDIAKPAVKKQFEDLLRPVIPNHRPGDFTQALMELGALICTPKSPSCADCPVRELCLAHREGCACELPVKTPPKGRKVQKRTVFVLTHNHSLALCRRPEKGLLAGMWELPCAEGQLDKKQAQTWLAERGICVNKLTPLGEARHVFSHLEWEMTGFLAEVEHPDGPTEWAYEPWRDIRRERAIPSAYRVYLKKLEEYFAE